MSSHENQTVTIMGTDENPAPASMASSQNPAPAPMHSGQDPAPASPGPEEVSAPVRKYGEIVRRWPTGISDIEYWHRLDQHYRDKETKPVPGGFMICGDRSWGRPDFTVGIPHEIANLVADAESTREVLEALEDLIGDLRRPHYNKSRFGLLNAREWDIGRLIRECDVPEGTALGPAFSKAGCQGPKMWLWWGPQYTTLEYDENGTRWITLRDDDNERLMRISLLD